MKALPILFAIFTTTVLGAATDQNEYAQAARDLDETISQQYAYLDKLPGGQLPQSDVLAQERAAVHDARSLLAYAEDRMASLADHHAITGRSFRDSWAVIPTYADVWIVGQGGQFIVDAVRENSPAAGAGLKAGDRILSVDAVPIDRAVAQFWEHLGLAVTPARAGYAARVLIAGRRDRARHFVIEDAAGQVRELNLPSLYDGDQAQGPPISVCTDLYHATIRFNNSLGDSATIEAFDTAMRAIPDGSALTLDLRDTPSGGNTTIARAIMGWFVDRPTGYQIHNRPVEERETGIARQWIEQVLPRIDRHRARLPTIIVGRWTGSMGEGIAVGFASMGARVEGTKMAGLNGSVDDVQIGKTDVFVKLPTERLMTTQGLPREDFVPQSPHDAHQLAGSC